MSTDTNKTAFLLYLDQEEYFRRLSGDECRELILAIFRYERNQTEPAFNSGLAEMAFVAFKQSLDRNRLKHEQISQIRSEVGRKGALAKHGKAGNCQNALAKGGKAAESDSDSDSDSENNPQTPKGDKSAIEKEALTVIEYLNKKAGRNYQKPTKELRARLKNKELTVRQCKMIIACKTAEWLHKPEMSENINPTTLFRPSNFDRYREQAERWVEEGQPVQGEKKDWNAGGQGHTVL